MNRKQYVFFLIKQGYLRSFSPTKGDRRFLIGFYCCIGLYALVASAFLLTSRPLYAWLMYATMGLGSGVGIAGLIWRFKDIARQLKEDEQDR